MSERSARLDDGVRDDARLHRTVGLSLAAVTVMAAVVAGFASSPATSILVLAAGVLLGVIALLWTSVRILSGDVELSPELLSLDTTAHGVDALASRKKMLLRALKDLENEHAIGKIAAEDYQEIAATYRAELKSVLHRIDEALAPHRARAEELARAHLAKVGLDALPAEQAKATPAEDERRADGATSTADEAKTAASAASAESERVACPSCAASNEPDAKFCKECATRLEDATEGADAS